ncbi:MAG: bifunctional hydroxymethylpyrimidine kinase/phosphomethylpyrimidine kinase [Actinomycetaceae bacterium]|nr:bifunctional hydroxymethylpyrimidine kinase/phosphomethylpyrimidine kinase [Actinomycetaceae bacterium]
MTHPSIPRILTIAGTDPTGGAGLAADIKSITAAGGFALAVTTALVSQNTHGVSAVTMPDARTIRDQLDAVSSDVDVDAVKVGMVSSIDYITTIKQWLEETKPTTIIIDPVMVATSGDRLLDAQAEDALRDLLVLATMITPNIPELEVLAGVKPGSITNFEQACQAAKTVARELSTVVVVKGGHLSDNPLINALVNAEGVITQAKAPRVETTNTHGTGCSLSSALATRLATGEGPHKALSWVTRWLYESLIHADALRVGSGNGPIDHSHRARRLEAVATNQPWADQALSIPQLHTPSDASRAITATDTESVIGAAGPWTQLLWNAGTPVLEEIWNLPFITGLRDGTLDEWEFTAYQRQDAIYLDLYSAALAHLAFRAQDPLEKVHWASDSATTLEVEQALHRDWLNRHRGEEFADALQMAKTPITAGYTDFLLARIATENYVVGTAAVLPCYWLYAEIGFKLIEFNHPDHVYTKWLTMYGDESFINSTKNAISIVEKQMELASPTDRERATRAFLGAAIWEREFFDQTNRMH